MKANKENIINYHKTTSNNSLSTWVRPNEDYAVADVILNIPFRDYYLKRDFQ